MWLEAQHCSRRHRHCVHIRLVQVWAAGSWRLQVCSCALMHTITTASTAGGVHTIKSKEFIRTHGQSTAVPGYKAHLPVLSYALRQTDFEFSYDDSTLHTAKRW